MKNKNFTFMSTSLKSSYEKEYGEAFIEGFSIGYAEGYAIGYAEGRAEGEKHKALARGKRPGNMTSKRHALQGQKNKNNYIRL